MTWFWFAFFFFVILLYWLFVSFQSSAKGETLQSQNDFGVENVENVKIVSERPIYSNQLSRDDNIDNLRIFYDCLQDTIMFLCEENWNEIGEREIERADYLWNSKHLFDHSNSLVPAIAMMIHPYVLEKSNHHYLWDQISTFKCNELILFHYFRWWNLSNWPETRIHKKVPSWWLHWHQGRSKSFQPS